MPRRWTNGGGGGACTRHRFVEASPVRMTGQDGPVNMRTVSDILEANARIARSENKFTLRRRK